MTILPSRLSIITQGTVNFGSAVYTTVDTVGTFFGVTITLSAISTAAFDINYSTSGPYGTDFKLAGGASGSIVFPSGAAPVVVPVMIAANNDITEDYIIRIEHGSQYNIGTTNQTTITCTPGATKPSSSSTGHTGNLSVYAGDGNIDHGATVNNTQFNNGIRLRGNASFVNCWFRGPVGTHDGTTHAGEEDYLVKYKNQSAYDQQTAVTFDRCTFGRYTTSGDSLINSAATLLRVGTFTLCMWSGLSADGVKPDQLHTFDSCYFEKLGEGSDWVGHTIHGDSIQTLGGGVNGLHAYNCFFNTPRGISGLSHNSALQFNNATGGGGGCNGVSQRNVRITSCWFGGGINCIQANCFTADGSSIVAHCRWPNWFPDNTDGYLASLIGGETQATFFSNVSLIGNKWHEAGNQSNYEGGGSHAAGEIIPILSTTAW